MRTATCLLFAVSLISPVFAQELKKPEVKKIEKTAPDKKVPEKKAEKSFINEQKTGKQAPAKK